MKHIITPSKYFESFWDIFSSKQSSTPTETVKSWDEIFKEYDLNMEIVYYEEEPIQSPSTKSSSGLQPIAGGWKGVTGTTIQKTGLPDKVASGTKGPRSAQGFAGDPMIFPLDVAKKIYRFNEAVTKPMTFLKAIHKKTTGFLYSWPKHHLDPENAENLICLKIYCKNRLVGKITETRDDYQRTIFLVKGYFYRDDMIKTPDLVFKNFKSGKYDETHQDIQDELNNQSEQPVSFAVATTSPNRNLGVQIQKAQTIILDWQQNNTKGGRRKFYGKGV
jgi:hypothetical protein